MKTFGSLFSGFEGVGIGARKAGFELVFGLEKDERIAEIANDNFSGHVRVTDILNANPFDFPKVDLLHASPPCPSFSMANKARGETALDIAMAEKVSEFIRVLQPEFFTLENVRGYASGFLPSKAKNKFVCKSFSLILTEFERSRYKVDYRIIDCADFGVPQNRKRLLLRASKSGWLPKLPEKEEWKGWYQTIEDLIPILPESKFADWQLKRLSRKFLETFIADGQSNDGQTSLTSRDASQPIFTIPAHAAKHKMRAFLMPNANSSSAVLRYAEEPAPTIANVNRVGNRPGAWLEQGRVVSMTPRALARFQTFPDEFKLPENNALACKGIGNAVPCLFYEKIAKQFLENL